MVTQIASANKARNWAQGRFGNDAKVEFKRIAEGLSHSNYEVIVTGNTNCPLPKRLFVKCMNYSVYLPKMFNFVTEYSGKLGIGPESYFACNDFIVTKFLDGEALSLEDFRKGEIGFPRLMANFHDKLLKAHKQFNSGFSFDSTICHILEENVRMLKLRHMGTVEKFRELTGNFDLIGQVEKYCQNCASNPPDENDMVICHGDLHYLNLKVIKLSGLMTFDFEFSHLNYWQYDIANTFCEFCGFEVDTSKYPTKVERTQFINAYLAERAKTNPYFATYDINSDGFTEKMIHGLVGSALAWTLWALNITPDKSDAEVEPFDYLQYAVKRFNFMKEILRNPKKYV